MQEVNYKNHPHYVAILLLVEEKELPKVGQNKDPIGMSERQPIVRSKLLRKGGSYEGIRRVILVAHEMDYKNHPHFTTIRRLVEEKELSKVRQNELHTCTGSGLPALVATGTAQIGADFLDCWLLRISCC